MLVISHDPLLGQKIIKTLPSDKKILLVNDRVISQLIYNHETRDVCILFDNEFFMPFLLLLLRLTNKQVTVIFLTTPKISTHPTLTQAIQYFAHRALLAVLAALAQQTIGGKKILLKKHRLNRQLLNERLFPSPIHNLSLLS